MSETAAVRIESAVYGAATQAAYKVVLFANTDWYLYNFRLPLARLLQSNGASVVMICPEGRYCAKLRAAGFRVVCISMGRQGGTLRSELRVIRELVELYRRERPEVVHHFTIKCVIYGSIAARIARVNATINAVAGLGYVFTSRSLRARLLRPLVRGMLRLALNGRRSRLILQNSDDAQLFRSEQLLPTASIRLIRGSGVDTRRFLPRVGALPDGTTTVLFASRLLRDKGVPEFVGAARLCKQLGVPVRFLLAGAPDPGNPTSIGEQELETWRRERVVEFLGHVDDMSAVLQRAHVVALPTVYGEGVPRILLEAAASGLPLIATRCPGCTEIVQHGVTGLLVDPHDVPGLAAAIIALHDDPGRRMAMGVAARGLAVREFDQELVLRRTWGVYEELMSAPARLRATVAAAASQSQRAVARLRAV